MADLTLDLHTSLSQGSTSLAHLSQRLIGELIKYPWSGVVVRPSLTMLKHLLLRNHMADQSRILCGASLGRGSEILFAACGSHEIFFSGTGRPISTKLGMMQRGLQPIIVCSNDDPGLTLTYFTARSNFVTWK